MLKLEYSDKVLCYLPSKTMALEILTRAETCNAIYKLFYVNLLDSVMLDGTGGNCVVVDG